MAQSKYTPHEFLKNSFKPLVAAFCSANATQKCTKNNLSFTEMIQPFCKLGSDVLYRDISGQVITVHNLEITIFDVHFRPAHPTVVKNLLSASVTHACETRFQKICVNEYILNVPATAPWFEDWRDTFLQIQVPSEHEFIKHYLACIFVTCASDNIPDFINELNNLNQSEKPKNIPKWFFPEVLKYYVVIHDNFQDNLANSSKALEYLKETYGANNCFLLRMNSRPPGNGNEHLPDPWSQFLTSKVKNPEKKFCNSIENSQHQKESAEDINNKVELPYHPLSPQIDEKTMNDGINENSSSEEIDHKNIVHGSCLSPEDVEQIKLFIHEFCTRALVPYVERKINQLQQIFANKSVTNSTFLSDPRRWFKSSKQNKSNTANDVSLYKHDSTELLMRKLGDICFMFGNYSGAMQAYNCARNDFLKDGALLYYAGAVEMYILSAFMSSEQPRKVFRDMEESVRTYLDTCKMPHFATRATLLIFECLKGHNLYGEAAHQLIRMTSEDSDLRSALFLEQAAYCFLNANPKLVRKYAFHMVLSGHRFSKASQKKHALRCYKQALQVFDKRGWNLATDHIYFTIGKLATALGFLEEAAQVFSLLNTESKQCQEQQEVFLREFLNIRNSLLIKEKKDRAIDLPIPILDCDNIKILVDAPTHSSAKPGKTHAQGITFSSNFYQESSQKWTKLEEMVVQEATGSLPLLFKPLVSLYTRDYWLNSNANSEAVSVVAEHIQISIKLTNPLDLVLYLKDIYLLWSFFQNDKQVSSTLHDKYFKTSVIKSCVIEAKSSQDVVFYVVPYSTGKIILNSIAFSLSNSPDLEQGVTLLGEQRILLKDKKQSSTEDLGKKIKFNVVPPAPLLQVSFVEINTDVVCDEVQLVTMEINNVGKIPVKTVYLAVSTPQYVSLADFENKTWIYDTIEDLKTPTVREKYLRKVCVTRLPLESGILHPGTSNMFNLWIKAPSTATTVNIDILIYYENLTHESIPRYRLVRHSWKLTTQEVLSGKVFCQQSLNSKSVEELCLMTKVSSFKKLQSLQILNTSLIKMLLLNPDWVLLNDLYLPNTVQINADQSIHLLIKAKRRRKEENSYSEILLDKEASSNFIPNDVCLDFAHKNFKHYDNFLEEFGTSDSSKETQFPNHLVLQWKATVVDNSGKKRDILGQITAPIILKQECDPATSLSYEVYQALDLTTSITKSNILEEAMKDQILFNLVHPVCIKHDFTKVKTCVVPVQVIIHNVVDTELVITLNSMETTRPIIHCKRPSNHFRWIGKSCAVKNLMPFSSEKISMKVAVFEPGTYDLGAWLEVSCHKKDQSNNVVLQNSRGESVLIVTS